MPTVFTRIIDGEIPGTFVWRDDRCVVFMSINPMARGHALVVPIEEVDHWVGADPALLAHLWEVTRVIGLAQQAAFSPERIGVIVAGYEVPHMHIHAIPTNTMAQLAFANAAASVNRDDLEAAAEALRAELRAMGRSEVVPAAVGPGAGPAITVAGSILYRERIALPEGAVVVVQVLDVSRADAPSVTLAEQRIETTHQVPIPFSIDVPAAALAAVVQASVAARIEVDGDLGWITDTNHPVNGETNVDLLLVRAKSS
jgi:histidine triad (HIT) family protein